MTTRVAHLPSYCSKYNPIDHRLFRHVTRALKAVVFHSTEANRNAAPRAIASTGLQVNETVLSAWRASKVRLVPGRLIQHDAILPRYNYTTLGCE
ncbi:ISAzo13-like element transposase-related protein [Rosistilla oblonga]|uniref:ISAzo13-like element transposase-related protein n=1 Tax=Rosistilla oblonga TaxID=2527990 RepID=UPI003A9713B8